MAAPKQQQVTVDVDEFVRTRDALSTAYMSLSASIDKAVKAYIEHTNVVLAGGSSLDVSYLTQPFHSLSGVASLAQNGLSGPPPSGGLAIPPPTPAPANNLDAIAAADVGIDGKRKRNYKPRDPNAPKRPLTAYFRYLQQNRKNITDEFTGDEARAPGEISRIATERWHKMSDKEKQPYQDEYRRELDKHVGEMEVYKDNGGDITDAQLKKLKETAARQMDSLHAGVSLDDELEKATDEPVKEPTPPPPPASTKKSKRASKAAATSTPKPAETFSSLDAPASRSSPDLKRKSIDGPEPESGKKKRGRKTKAEKEAEEAKAKDSSPSKPADSDAVEASGKKKKEASRRRKKGGDS
ncbi:hypothetical protein K431DRAFT_289006 [Polychaeton citri CBS 116435]|uniref:HMG box domain-containing protein n=1 Tax=Polychaeton citri CBS 116435 TaxID=1314669 RepID=A0A9P4Q2N7_9PEZI|nr:hypothetical protein K431DRAFT_289006 [Polychaeton citri CBS 116435]